MLLSLPLSSVLAESFVLRDCFVNVEREFSQESVIMSSLRAKTGDNRTVEATIDTINVLGNEYC